MTAVVTDDMIDRGFAALARASFVDADLSESYVRSVAMEVVTAAMNPPEDRACLCGCPHERTLNSRFYSDACRTRHWKAETGYVKPGARRTENGGNGGEKGHSRPRRPGGLQVAFGPARSALAAEFEKHGLTYPKARATAVLRRALSRRQRERFDTRNEPEEARHTRSPKSLV